MSTTSGGGDDKRIFLRKASGLIRMASPFDTFIFNIGLVSVGLGVGTIMFYGPAYYAGGDLLVACIVAGVAMACIAFGMITWTVTLPRSGGIYVFGSRSLPPFVALTLSLVEIVTWLFYCAIAAYWIILVLSGVILAAGMKRYFLIQKIVFTTALLGSLLLILVLLTGSNEEFVAQF